MGEVSAEAEVSCGLAVFDQLAEVCAGDAGQGRMGTGRPSPASFHNY
jgi:hypothetical protein